MISMSMMSMSMMPSQSLDSYLSQLQSLLLTSYSSRWLQFWWWWCWSQWCRRNPWPYICHNCNTCFLLSILQGDYNVGDDNVGDDDVDDADVDDVNDAVALLGLIFVTTAILASYFLLFKLMRMLIMMILVKNYIPVFSSRWFLFAWWLSMFGECRPKLGQRIRSSESRWSSQSWFSFVGRGPGFGKSWQLLLTHLNWKPGNRRKNSIGRVQCLFAGWALDETRAWPANSIIFEYLSS